MDYSWPGSSLHGIFQARLLESDSHSLVPDSATPWSAAHHLCSLCLRDFPGKNTGMGCHFLPQGIIPIQGSNPHLLPLLHWREDSLPLVSLRRLQFSVAVILSDWREQRKPGKMGILKMIIADTYWTLRLGVVISTLRWFYHFFTMLLWGEGPYGPCPYTMSSACLLSVENFSQRISLTRETRNVETKGNSQRRLNNNVVKDLYFFLKGYS